MKNISSDIFFLAFAIDTVTIKFIKGSIAAKELFLALFY
jgi:hypothetical protein